MKASAYEALAEFARRSPEHPRIRSITFSTDRGEEWVATVGQEMSGYLQPGGFNSRGHQVKDKQRIYARHKVLAIFGPAPYSVVTDAPPIGTSRSEWSNPLLAGEPTIIEYFTDA